MLPSEPQTIGGVLDSGFNIYRKTFKSVAGLAVIFALLAASANIGMMSVVDLEGLAALSAADPDDIPVMPKISPMFWVFGLLSLVILFVFLLSVAHRQWDLVREREPSLTRDIGRGLALVIPTLFASVLYYLAVVIGLLLIIIPGLILLVSFSLYMFVPIVEDRGAWLTIGRSHALVWGGNWFRTAAVLTVLTVIIGALSLGVQLVLGSTSGVDALFAPTTPSALATIVGSLLMYIMYPLATAGMLALYSDLLIRKQARDLDSKLKALELTPGEGASAHQSVS